MMGLVERLAAKYGGELSDSEIESMPSKDTARWWLQAIADELEANVVGVPFARVSDAAHWLREAATTRTPQEGQNGA